MRCEQIIIGAGLIGSAVAMALGERGHGSGTVVVDLDLEGTLSSSELNAGGVRQIWGRSINVECARKSIDYFSKLGGSVGYRPCGYLWLHGEATWDVARDWVSNHSSSEWPTEVLGIDGIQRSAPFLDKLDGVVGAIWGRRDGLINSNLLKNHFRDLAKKSGVRFLDRLWVEAIAPVADGFEVVALRVPAALAEETKSSIYRGERVEGERVVLRSKRLVNCGGPWASDIAKRAGYTCPSKSVRRQICVFESRDVDLTRYGMTVDTSGVYFHPEANNGMGGYADPAEPDGVNFDYEGAQFFEEKIWPALYERSSQFERLKHLTGWAGLYEVSPDETGIVGRVTSKAGYRGGGALYEAHSFSGHGVMHSYAVGVGLAELITQGRFSTLDLEPLSADRFSGNGAGLLHERLVI